MKNTLDEEKLYQIRPVKKYGTKLVGLEQSLPGTIPQIDNNQLLIGLIKGSSRSAAIGLYNKKMYSKFLKLVNLAPWQGHSCERELYAVSKEKCMRRKGRVYL